ncbi:SDR family oxidoreductase [Salinibius halmophilus]|uniref:SDR family oxidoreductase n=1 Tax=Salinibius halmophilus TaxID=1853216 RepID=UPI000E67359A|nr:SDR family oxidoreductase [Salinibius halmophilus]
MAKLAVITGANRGIGLALAKQLSAKGYEVIGICRESSTELEGLAARVITGIDVTDQACIERAATELKGKQIDLLINNAGLLDDNVLGSIELDSIRAMMEINAYAPLKVTEALLPNLASGSKVALITSRMGSIADNTSGGRYGYRASKAALNAFGKSLAVDLAPQGISVVILHPGYVATRMVGYRGMIEPDDSARGLVERIEGLSLQNSGSFWHSNGEELPW